MLINIKKIFSGLIKTIFPRKCIGCGVPDFWICEKCITKIPKSNNNPFDWSVSVFTYQNRVVRKAVWLLKFNKKHSVLEDLKLPINKSFDSFLSKKKISDKNGEKIFLIPIPITKRSQEKRGYNQSELLAKCISKNRAEVRIENGVLFKSKNHISQNKIKNRKERWENVKNSFSVKNIEKLRGQTVILVDDVVTTGATIQEAKKVLNKNGVKKVFAFSVGH